MDNFIYRNLVKETIGLANKALILIIWKEFVNELKISGILEAPCQAGYCHAPCHVQDN